MTDTNTESTKSETDLDTEIEDVGINLQVPNENELISIGVSIGALDSIINQNNKSESQYKQNLDIEAKIETMTSSSNEIAILPSIEPVEEEEFYREDAWRKLSLHLFIMSFAGKPIYSLHGDENKLAGLMGVMQALDSFVSPDNNQLQQIVAEDRRFVFLSRNQIILVAVAYIKEPILFTLTLRVIETAFERSKNLDLRVWLGDSDRHFKGIVEIVQSSCGPFLGAVTSISISATLRETIANTIISGIKGHDVVFGILFSNCRLVSFVRMKDQFLHPMDIHLLINLLKTSKSLKNAETNWLPICLPKFDANGYLYANISYLDAKNCLVLLSVDKNQFSALQEARKIIYNKLNLLSNGTFFDILDSSKKISLSQFDDSYRPIRHFVFKYSIIAQYVSSEWGKPYALKFDNFTNEDEKEEPLKYIEEQILSWRADVMSSYRRMHSRLHSNNLNKPIIEQIFESFETEAYFAWRSPQFEIYVTFEPLINRAIAQELTKKLSKYILSEKKRLFILSSPTF